MMGWDYGLSTPHACWEKTWKRGCEQRQPPTLNVSGFTVGGGKHFVLGKENKKGTSKWKDISVASLLTEDKFCEKTVPQD